MKKNQRKKQQLGDYESLFNSLSAGIFQTDIKGNYIAMNTAGAKIMGFDSPEQLMKNRIRSSELYANPKEREHIVKQIKKNGFIKDYVTKGIRPDNTTYWLSSTINLIKDKDNNIVGYEGVFNDVTAKVKLEDNIKEIIRFKKSLMNISSAAISMEDYDSFLNLILKELGMAAGCCRAYIIEFNRDRERGIKRGYEWTTKGIKPEIRFIKDFYAKHAPEVTHNLKKSSITSTSSIIRVSAKEKRLLEKIGIKPAIIIPIFVNHEIHGLIGLEGSRYNKDCAEENIKILETTSNILSQVIEKKSLFETLAESENKYRNLVENLNYGIYIMQDNIIRYINDNLVKTLGADKKNIIGKEFFKFVHKEDIEMFLEESARRQSGQVPFRRYKARLVKDDGSSIQVEICSSFIHYNGRGAIQGTIRDRTAEQESEKERKKLNQIIRKIKPIRIPLTTKEKLIFYSIAKNPFSRDKEISLKTNVPISTISAIRNRLRKEGYYNEVIIPDFSKLGFSSLYIALESIGNKNNIPIKKQKDNPITSRLEKHPNLFYSLESSNSSVRFALSSQDLYSESGGNSAIKDITSNSKHFSSDNVLHLPFRISKFARFFDFSDIIKNRLHIDIDAGQNKKCITFREKKRKFTKKEKIILYSLCRFPNLNDTKLSKKIKIPRSTISVIRKRLIKDGMIRKSNIPVFSRIGCELMTIVRYKLIRPIDRSKCPSMESPSSFLIGNNKRELICLSLHQNYSMFKATVQDIINCLYDHKFINTEPEIKIIPMESIHELKMDFASLVKERFRLDVDF